MELFAEANVAALQKGLEQILSRNGRGSTGTKRGSRGVQEVSTSTLKETKVGHTDRKGEAGIRHTSLVTLN